MFCRNCGNKVEDGSVFCQMCGTKLTETETETTPVSPAIDKPAPEIKPVAETPVNTTPAKAPATEDFLSSQPVIDFSFTGFNTATKPAVEEPVIPESPIITPVFEEPVVEPIIEEPVIVPVIEETAVAEEPAKRFCPNCGTVLEDAERFCPECGSLIEAAIEPEPVAEPIVEEPVVVPVVEEPVIVPVIEETAVAEEPAKRFCPNCGTVLEDAERFCPECGSLIEAAIEPEPVAEPIVEEPVVVPVVEEPITYITPNSPTEYLNNAIARIIPTFTGSENLSEVIVKCDPQMIDIKIGTADTSTLFAAFSALEYYIANGADKNVLGVVQLKIISAVKARI